MTKQSQQPATTTTIKSPDATRSVWSDLPRRLGTICIGFPLVWIMLSQPNLARIFFMGAHGISLWEFTLLEPHQWRRHEEPNTKQELLFRLLYCILSVLLATLTVDNDPGFFFMLSFSAGTLAWLERQHWILGLLVVTLPFRAWVGLAPRDFASTISVLLVVWNCDTGALLFGRISNKLGLSRLAVPKWILRISPAKSMEGFLGGIIGGVWTAISWIPILVEKASIETSPGFDSLWETQSSRFRLGMTLSLLAIIGDLVESSIKRQSQAKDSGSFLPGHGGILDRFDSSLLAVLFYSYVLTMNA